MCKRLVKIESVLKDAHKSLFRKQRSSLGDFVDQLTPKALILQEDNIDVRQDIDDVKILLGETNRPSLKMLPFLQKVKSQVSVSFKEMERAHVLQKLCEMIF